MTHSYNEFLGVAAGIISVMAFVPYVVAIFRGRTRPSGPSWWAWTLINLVVFLSAWAAGAGWEVLVLPAWLCLSELFVAILSVGRGDNKWDWTNIVCVAGACIGITLWYLTGQPLIALTFSIGADLLAFIPTFRHAWQSPQEEDRLGWTLGWLSAVCEVFAVGHWSLAEAGWPVYYVLGMTLVLVFVWRPVFGRAPMRRIF